MKKVLFKFNAIVLFVVLSINFLEQRCFAQDKTKTSTGRVSIVSPKNGETVGQEFKLKLNSEGIKISPLSKKEATTAYHTIIIQGGWIGSGSVIPKDGEHIHLENGETETTIKLAPGEYTVTAQLADSDRKSLGQEASNTVRIKVK